MRQTVAQYKASVKRLAPDLDIRWDGQYWPYPQSRSSRLLCYLGNDPQASPLDTWAHVWALPVVNTDVPGALIRLAEGSITPARLVAELRQRAVTISIVYGAGAGGV